MKKKLNRSASTFVLDCSVTMAWFFEDEAGGYAEAVEDALGSTVAEVPAIWPLEVANALVVGERRKRVTEAKVTQLLQLLKVLPITIDDQTIARPWQETLHLARARELSVYDAAYLELALRLGLPLATLDDRLKKASGPVGVQVYEP